MKYLSMLIITILLTVGTSAQVVIPPLPIVLPPSNLDEICEVYQALESLNGPNCLNPVWWDIDGYININAVIRYVDDSNNIQVGRVAGYAWNRNENRYYYLLEAYNTVGEFVNIAPERIDN